MNIMNFTELISTGILIIGILAFCVSVVTQVLKNVGGLKNIPTDILVFVLSIAMTVVTFMAFMQIKGYPIVWYMVVAAVILGFFVAFVSMFGWERLTSLRDRYIYKDELYEDEMDPENEFELVEGLKPLEDDTETPSEETEAKE